jgi:hypothetical protein
VQWLLERSRVPVLSWYTTYRAASTRANKNAATIKTQKKQLAQPWSTPRPCAYTRKKYFWISKQLDISALHFRGFLANSFSRHTTDSGSALLCSTYFPGPVTNYDFRWPYFPSWRLHSDGIAHQAISDFIIIITGRLSYLSSFGSAVSCLQTAEKKVILFSWGRGRG